MVALAISMFGVESFFAAKDTFFLNNSSFANIVIMLALAVRVGYEFVKRGGKFSPLTSVTWQASMLLLAFTLMTGVWTPAFDQYRTNWIRGAPYVVAYLLLLPTLFSSYKVARDSLVWVLGMGVVISMLLYFTCEWEYRGVVVAGQESRRGQRDTAAILAIAQLGGTIAILAALYRSGKSGGLFAIGRWVLVALGLMLALKTGSRGQTIFAFACIALFVPINNRSLSFRGAVFTVLSLGVFGGLAFFLFENFATHGRWGSTLNSLSERQLMWNFMLDIWFREGPMAWIFGMGSAASYNYVGFYIHNVPLEILIECGVIGAVIYARLCFETGKNLYNGVAQAGSIDPDRFNIVIVYSSLFAFECLCTLKSGSLFGQQIFMFYAIAIEIAMRGWKQDSARMQYEQFR